LIYSLNIGTAAPFFKDTAHAMEKWLYMRDDCLS